MLKYISNLLYPADCILCGKNNSDYICEKCQKRINKYEKNKYFNKNEARIFLKTKKVYFDNLFYLYEYKRLIRSLILKYKFGGKSYYCNFFAKMLLNCKKTYFILNFYDIIIPVPMDLNKKLSRGYNQTELITAILSRKTGIIDGKNYVEKSRKTKTQSLLNSFERKENVKNAFRVTKKLVGKKIVVFDDICTTGSTINEMSKVLKENGANEITVIVLAKD